MISFWKRKKCPMIQIRTFNLPVSIRSEYLSVDIPGVLGVVRIKNSPFNFERLLFCSTLFDTYFEYPKIIVSDYTGKTKDIDIYKVSNLSRIDEKFIKFKNISFAYMSDELKRFVTIVSSANRVANNNAVECVKTGRYENQTGISSGWIRLQ